MDSVEDNSVPSQSPATVGAISSFPQTQWTIVLMVREENLDKATAAMQELCGRYRYPIYSFIRRNSNPHDAEDLTQGFFEYLLKYETLRGKSHQGEVSHFLVGLAQAFSSK